MALISFRMPFPRVPITFIPPTYGERDAFGNQVETYDEDNAITVDGCYAIGDTTDDIEEDRPHGERVLVTCYLPKTFNADIRNAICRIGGNDALVSAQKFKVQGIPLSYMRDAVPGDMSTVVRLVEYAG